jgi:hypothetical protein
MTVSRDRQLEAAKRARAALVVGFLSSSQKAAELLETSRQIAARAIDAHRRSVFGPATEPVRMIEPPSFRRAKVFCTVNSVPIALMLNILSQCSSLILPKGANSPTPALAKIISIRPSP